ncbi:hypothetical protein K438DRAFT_341201 [Mycena galopus ATCC 62051]|nr:hypothetical protein K438DRAFT_341201 [Mycena galopus ATCC 62051]
MQWCRGCENGGVVVPCALCSRHICGQCIEFPEDIEDKAIQFYCSKCWTTNNPKIPSWKATPEGDLWTAPGSLLASPPEQVLPILVPEGLQDLIKKAAGSMLIFLACGSLHSGESKVQAGAFVRRAGIQYGFGFTTKDFLPAVATTFLQDTVRAFFIGGYGKKFSHILATHYELGIHTDVVVYFHDGNTFRYTWHHPKLHPYEQPLRVQCSNCFTLEMHDIADYSEDKVVLRCRCKHMLVYLNARGGRPLLHIEDGPWKKTDTSVAGAWYGQWAVMQSECPNDPPSFPYPAVRKTDSVPV